MLKIIKITKKKARYLGLSLVGLLITVAIISALAALSVPNLLQLRIRANEAWAIATLMKLASAFDTYRAMQNTYPPDFAALRTINPPLIDEQLASSAEKEGYKFMIDTNDPPSRNTFTIYAGPVKKGTTGNHWYKIDESGTVYVAIDVALDNLTNPVWAPMGGAD